MKIALITLKYTQSNSVCYVKDGQAIGIGAGQQSRIHCTRLAGTEGRQLVPSSVSKVMGLQFVDRSGKSRTEITLSTFTWVTSTMDVLADGVWETIFKVKPRCVYQRGKASNHSVGFAECNTGFRRFLPLLDNIERAHRAV